MCIVLAGVGPLSTVFVSCRSTGSNFFFGGGGGGCSRITIHQIEGNRVLFFFDGGGGIYPYSNFSVDTLFNLFSSLNRDRDKQISPKNLRSVFVERKNRFFFHNRAGVVTSTTSRKFYINYKK